MLKEIVKEKKDLEKISSLRLQCWNATRWLGRSQCLISLCRSYEYILEHLTEFAESRSEKIKDKVLATQLYQKLTSYNTFLFIHMYRDLAVIMARISKSLQIRDIQIRDVGCLILRLCEKLKGNYPADSDIPTPLLGDGAVNKIMEDLFDESFDKLLMMIFFKLIYRYS